MVLGGVRADLVVTERSKSISLASKRIALIPGAESLGSEDR
jgi:hypothetical protein